MKKFNEYNPENEEVDLIEDTESLLEMEAPKTKFKYEIAANLNKIRKAQKFLIDVAQLCTEMQVDIQKTKVNATRFKKNAPEVINDIDNYLEKIFLKLKEETKDGKPNHLMFFADSLRIALEELQDLKFRQDIEE